MDTEHSKLPWSVDVETPSDVNDPDGYYIVDCCGCTTSEAQDEANAAFIVKACNNHEALIEHLRRMTDYTNAALAGLPLPSWAAQDEEDARAALEAAK
jgi:hypothetical protein